MKRRAAAETGVGKREEISRWSSVIADIELSNYELKSCPYSTVDWAKGFDRKKMGREENVAVGYRLSVGVIVSALCCCLGSMQKRSLLMSCMPREMLRLLFIIIPHVFIVP